MKRTLTAGLTVVLLLALCVPARADMLWEPLGNTFYDRHSAACKYIGRNYYANGGEGFVTLWDAPDGSMVEAQYENGTRLCVYWQYQDWGCITVFVKNGDDINGWVPMADLKLIYDHISFEEEYGDQFRDYGGEFADYGGREGDELWMWETPLDGEPMEKTTMQAEFLEALQGGRNDRSYISKIYTDESGRNWGFVSYMFGFRNFWILLDDPACTSIMTSCIPEVDQMIASGDLVAPQPPKLPAKSYTPYILVGTVVAVTAALLAIFYGKKRKHQVK